MLCRPEDALAVGGAVALTLAARCRSSHALLAVWVAGTRGSVRAPANAGARRLATTLGARGHDATATGRLVVVALAEPLASAAAEAERAEAVASDIPTAVVLAGARDDTADPLLRSVDAVLVAAPAGADAAVSELALAGLAPLGVDARAVELPPVPVAARALAASGLAAPPPLRGPIEEALPA
ncbi:MAG TPA: hypothetical protein VGW10_02820 [Solirubrobacteraceae bacterium]|nr:hypothetical protein [Solirubrobacteraceae bacterium]